MNMKVGMKTALAFLCLLLLSWGGPNLPGEKQAALLLDDFDGTIDFSAQEPPSGLGGSWAVTDPGDIEQEAPPASSDPVLGDSQGEDPGDLPPLTANDLGTWTDYNGIIFENAVLYDSQSGGGLAVGGSVAFYDDLRVGSTYSSEYDPTRHIGEYRNEQNYPALLLGANALEVGQNATTLEVYGGAIAMTPEMLEVNGGLSVGLTAKTGSGYRPAERALLEEWFARQKKLVTATSQLMLEANDVAIDLEELSDGSYMDQGPGRFRNQRFAVNGEVYENALFITVHTGREVNFGQWWPVYSIIRMNVDWAIDYDLLVFNFPDAINVTMNGSAFSIENMLHWSTTVDAWVGERGLEERRALAEKVVYNFPNAGSVEANQALIQGTVLAPNASFTGIGFGDNGHIYGHIVAKSYQARGNFTIHAFALTHWVADIVEDTLSGRPDSGNINLRHYLFFRGDPTTIRASGGQFILENEDGAYFDGKGGFAPNAEDAQVFESVPDGYTLMRDVPLGNYMLINQMAPEGFTMNQYNLGNPATYYRYPVRIGAPGETVEAVRYSEPDFLDLFFRKIDGGTGAGIPGATFVLLREADEYQDATIGGAFTSDEHGNFASYHVPAGTYHLVEVESPEGYEMLENGEFPFVVAWDSAKGRLVVRSPEGETFPATQENPLDIINRAGAAQNAILIVKYARDPKEPDTNYPLPGAEFQLFREEEGGWRRVTQNAVGEELTLLTNQFGYQRLQNLPEGRYRLVETTAPPGYALSNPYADSGDPGAFPGGYAHAFEFSQDTSFHTAYIPGNPLEADVVVVAQGPLLEDMAPLWGATFRLEHQLAGGGAWEELVYATDTQPDGTMVLEGLPAGRYRLTQKKAPPGYRPLEPADIFFTISFDSGGAPHVSAEYNGEAVGADTEPVGLSDGDRVALQVRHQAKLCDYLVYKVDGSVPSGHEAAYLEGARFRLRRRTDLRTGWRDYGPAFDSRLLYGQDGEPVLDSNGNHAAAAVFEPGLLYGSYQLVELHPPDGYHPGSDIQVTFEDGEIGAQVHLFTITEAMTGTGYTSTYTAANYRDGYSTRLRFRSVDAEDHGRALSGAEFALYHCGRDHEHDDLLTENSCWTVSTPVIEISNAAGVVIFEDLVRGDYLLRESHAPAGYRLPNTYWAVVVDAQNQAIAIEPTNSAAYPFVPIEESGVEWLLINRRQWAMPVTGGGGREVYFRTGFAVTAAATCLLIKRTLEKRKQR